jgi:ectoine hydroxylase-related dioxygenase (phytanoyl-CoA dioxygenase family)
MKFKLNQEKIHSFRKDGFVRIENIISKKEAEACRLAGVNAVKNFDFRGEGSYQNRLTQIVNIWEQDEVFKGISFHKNVTSAATQLSGTSLRIFHDHMLSKKPMNGAATEWHQDRPYWPFEDEPVTLSAWIALQDTNVEMGCMSFIPGSHYYNKLPSHSLGEPDALFKVAPELRYIPSVTVPLKAGDCTFHYGRTAHRAAPNMTETWRMAQTIIYIDENTILAEKGHCVTSALVAEGSLKVGEKLDHPRFKKVS